MKSLLAILILINILAFFMFSHLQKQAELKGAQSTEEQGLPLSSPQPVVLLSELSAAELEALNPTSEVIAKPVGEQSSEDIIPSEIER